MNEHDQHTTGAIAEALTKVQAELPKLERDRTVEVEKKSGGTYSYSYVTLANLNDAILPLLARNGLAFAAMPGTGSDGKMCLRYQLLHASGEQLSGEFPISGEGGIQMVGGRITYARRYVLAALVGVAADEDDESRLTDSGPGTAQRAAKPRKSTAGTTGKTAARKTATSGPPLPNENPNAISADQIKAIGTLMTKAEITDRDAALRWVADVIGREVASRNELTKAEASQVIEALKVEIGDLPDAFPDEPKPAADARAEDYQHGGPA